MRGTATKRRSCERKRPGGDGMRINLRVFALLVFALGSLAGGAAADPTFTSIYNFGSGSDGPGASALVMDSNGAFYGTTVMGGTTGCGGAGCGTVFELTPPSNLGGTWGHNVLYAFSDWDDGASPLGG